jgi:hypothetical protein
MGVLSCTLGALACEVVPSDEECNGIDDDCDGNIDEGDPGGGEACNTGLPGACSVGVTQCETGAITCKGPAPANEICNGEDDDCNGEADDSPVCKKIVFATSQVYDGQLGGLVGADAVCQGHAVAASLPGTFMAWLSSTTVDARDRLNHLGKPYVLVDNTVVANDWSDLVDGTLQHGIHMTELGTTPPFGSAGSTSPSAWTSTHPDGAYVAPPVQSTCNEWTSTTAAGIFGRTYYTDDTWTFFSGTQCYKTASLYCFEQ